MKTAGTHTAGKIQPSATGVGDNINTSYHGNIFARSLFTGAAVPAKYKYSTQITSLCIVPLT